MRACVEAERLNDLISIAAVPLIPVGVLFFLHPPYAYIYVLRFTFLTSAITLAIGLPILLRVRLFTNSRWIRDGDIAFFSESRTMLVIRVAFIVAAFAMVLSAISSAIVYRFLTLFFIATVFLYAFVVDAVPQIKALVTASFRTFIAVDSEGFTVRGTDGRVSTFVWEDSPRVLGVSRRGRLVLTKSKSGPAEVTFGTLPVRYSVMERIVNHYVDHPEDRAALASEEGLRQIERLSR